MQAAEVLASLPPPAGLSVESADEVRGDSVVLSFPLPVRSQLVSLTLAERAVVKELLLGRSNAQIAASRSVAENTVKNQVSAVFQKFGVHSRLDLALRLGCAVASGSGSEDCAEYHTL